MNATPLLSKGVDPSENDESGFVSHVYYVSTETPHDLCFPMTITIIIPIFGLLALCFIRDKYVSKRCAIVGTVLLIIYVIIGTGFLANYLKWISIF